MPDLIRYDLLVQDALRGVVRQVLAEVSRNGLQGEHHFFITFKTATPGLRLSNRMRERYPDEMTIILQHQFWGLAVLDTGFEVGLSFHNTPEKLFVPFGAITLFQDPSVNFGLKFDVRDAAQPDAAHPGGEDLAPAGTKRGLVAVDAPPSLPATVPAKPASKPSEKGRGSDKPKPVLAPVPNASAEPEAGGPKVVSIDSFRKKP